MNPIRLLHIAASKPPLAHVVRRQYEKRFRRETARGSFRGIFPNFESAIASSPAGTPVGYDHEAAGQMYSDRPIFAEDYAILFWLRTLLQPGWRVFDYGGHAGGMFDAFKKVIALPTGVQWTIYDVPAAVRQGETLNAKRAQPIPAFTTSMNDAEDANILLASGSPQYVDVDFSRTILNLKARPAHLLINQVPLHEVHEFVTLQNISTSFCPYWIRNRQRFFQPLLDNGYEMVDTWTNPGKECRIPTYPDYTRPTYYGAYLRRK